MILDPQVWKWGLVEELALFEAIPLETDLPEGARDYRVERFLFLAAFIMRKIMEGHRFAGVPLSMQVPVARYKRINPDEEMNFSNFGDLQRFYDCEREYCETMELERLCNGFIHSFVFQPESQNGELDYVIFTSDLMKDKGLYRLEFKDLRAAILEVAAS